MNGKGWFRIRSRHFVLALLFGALALAACHGHAQDQTEADKLATLLNWKPGSIVAEIGAGDGGLTLAAAERVGPTGRVYTTELDPKKLAKLESLAAAQKTHNIIVVKAGEAETNLPPSAVIPSSCGVFTITSRNRRKRTPAYSNRSSPAASLPSSIFHLGRARQPRAGKGRAEKPGRARHAKATADR